MISTDEFALSYHSRIQDLANHYNSINWNMHSIFVVLHSGLAGWIYISMVPAVGSLWRGESVGAIVALAASCAGLYLADAWYLMFQRHRLFIKTFHAKLRELEQNFRSANNELSEFRVHTLLSPVLASTTKNHGDIPTSSVIDRVQSAFIRAYFVMIGISLIRWVWTMLPIESEGAIASAYHTILATFFH